MGKVGSDSTIFDAWERVEKVKRSEMMWIRNRAYFLFRSSRFSGYVNN